ncbi:hypothetical protein NQZ68_003024 [Dissostichus eleginoides]|nr:hypothetical protein NQZ68_003024 [Dissostichus eleginoides]
MRKRRAEILTNGSAWKRASHLFSEKKGFLYCSMELTSKLSERDALFISNRHHMAPEELTQNNWTGLQRQLLSNVICTS